MAVEMSGRPVVLSVQSWVATGHVGNAAAMFPLQRLGAEVWGVHTVQFSNHPGHGGFRGWVFGAAEVRDVVEGIAARGLLGRCDAVLSGYLGDAGIGEAVLGAVAAVRGANGAALYCCDPVIGDAGRVFVRDGIEGLLRERAVPEADILTPNQFELGRLSGLDGLREGVAAVQGRMRPGGPGLVLVTSCREADTPGDALDMVAADRAGRWRLRLPLLPIAPNGAGDLVAALFLLHVLRGEGAAGALSRAGSAVAGVLRRTVADKAAELSLVAAQEELVRPEILYRATAMP